MYNTRSNIIAAVAGSMMLFLCSCHNDSQADNAKTIDHKDSVYLASYAFKTGDGWGYTITVDNKLFIRQTDIPAIQGLKSFATEEDALKVAHLVISKIKTHQRPTILQDDLKALGIIE